MSCVMNGTDGLGVHLDESDPVDASTGKTTWRAAISGHAVAVRLRARRLLQGSLLLVGSAAHLQPPMLSIGPFALLRGATERGNGVSSYP
jgi:hypothetical protein